jgi:hypothetical protein
MPVIAASAGNYPVSLLILDNFLLWILIFEYYAKRFFKKVLNNHNIIVDSDWHNDTFSDAHQFSVWR